MRNSKLLLAALAAMATIGLAAPAVADPVVPVTLLSYDFTTSTERTLLTGTLVTSGDPGPFIGAFYLDLDLGGGNQLLGVLAFCDDLTNDIDPGGVPYDYFATTTAAGVNNYLSPLSQASINNIIGLVYSANLSILDPSQGAAYQLAIWDLEYPGETINADAGVADPNLQANADALIANAAADFAAFQADGTFDAVQLESPCDPALAGSITFHSAPFGDDPNCQVQGLILVVPNGHTRNLPEPGTIALLGSGLIGFGALRRRRRKPA